MSTERGRNMVNNYNFNGLGMSLGNLSRLSRARTRSISAENFTGEKGQGGMATEGTGVSCARDLGVGWKISPSVAIAPQSTFSLADIHGPGAIQHIWITNHGIQLRPGALRYAAPSELDLMARLAGLTLEHRWAGWRGEPFTSLSRLHVSVYAKN